MRMFTTRTMIARTRNSGAEDARAPDASRAAWTVAGRVSRVFGERFTMSRGEKANELRAALGDPQ